MTPDDDRDVMITGGLRLPLAQPRTPDGMFKAAVEFQAEELSDPESLAPHRRECSISE